MVVLWCWRWAEQAQARAMLENIQVTSAPVTRMALEPYPVNPYRWHAILETADFYQTAEINTWTGTSTATRSATSSTNPPTLPPWKPPNRPCSDRSTSTGERWAVVRDLGQEPVPGHEPAQPAA